MNRSIFVKSLFLGLGALVVAATIGREPSASAQGATGGVPGSPYVTIAPENINNYSPLLTCESDADCGEVAPRCASTTATCALGFPDATVPYCAFTPKGIVGSTSCKCFAGQRKFCYTPDSSGNLVLGTQICVVASFKLSNWSTTCTPL